MTIRSFYRALVFMAPLACAGMAANAEDQKPVNPIAVREFLDEMKQGFPRCQDSCRLCHLTFGGERE
jgi:hypothetical protein